MTQSPELSGPGASARASRLGPSLSLLGLAFWVVTFAVYLLLKPIPSLPGEPFRRETGIQLLLTFVLSGIGVFAASIFAALGLFLSLSERRHHPGPRATRGVVLGGMGCALLIFVVVEILRVAFQTT